MSSIPDDQSLGEAGQRAVHRGYGTVPRLPRAAAAPVDKPIRAAGGAATAHNIKFSGAGDAVNATVTTRNGTILYSAQLRLVFWGREWASASAPVPMTSVIADVQSIVAGPYLLGLQQYAVSRVWVDRIIDLTDEDPPHNPFHGSGVLSQNDAEARIGQLISDGKVPEPDEDTTPAVYVVFLPSSVAGTSLGLPPDIVGDHTRLLQIDPDDFWYSDVPVAWVSNDGDRGDVSATFSHELVEALTDPYGDGWQVEPTSRFNWHEIADVCQSTYLLNGVVVSSYWSRADNACIVPDQSFTRYQVEWIWRPDHIEWLGGTDQDSNPWQLPRQAVMDRIRGGDVFYVEGGSSGEKTLVGIYYLDPTHPYLATYPDGFADDNLLALPQHPPI